MRILKSKPANLSFAAKTAYMALVLLSVLGVWLGLLSVVLAVGAMELEGAGITLAVGLMVGFGSIGLLMTTVGRLGANYRRRFYAGR